MAAAILDYAIRTTDRGLRIMLTGAMMAGVFFAIWRLGRWWRRQRWSEAAAAQALQHAFPALGDRVASSLEFLRQDEGDPLAGSAPLRRAVIAEATARLDELPAEEVAQRRSVPQAISAALAALLVAFSFAIVAPTATQTALARLAAPWNNVEWPRRNNLEFVDPPLLLARGDTFEVALVDAGSLLPSEVAIEYRDDAAGHRRTDKTWMQRVGNTMVARRENVRRSFEFRASGGDHRTMSWKAVNVVDRPTVVDAQITIAPPDYSGLPQLKATSHARALAGSQVRVAATTSEPLNSAKLLPTPGDAIEVNLTGSSLLVPAERWKLDTGEPGVILRPQVAMTAPTGLQGLAILPTIEVVPDQVPTLTWSRPADDQFVLAAARLPLEVMARDDLALANVRLMVAASNVAAGEENGGELRVDTPRQIELFAGPPLPPSRDVLPQEGERLATRIVTYELDLAPLNLVAGNVLELAATAEDYKPQEGATRTRRRVTIITDAELRSQLAASQANILRLLEQALADERVAREQSMRAVTRAGSGEVIERESLDDLMSARLSQQGVRRTLTGPNTGVVDLTRTVLDRIAVNGVQHAALVAQLENIRNTIADLDEQSLTAAERHLTDLRKTFESHLGQAAVDEMAAPIAALGTEQQRIIRVLEELIDQASAWSDAERFVRELARLEREQRELRELAINLARQNLLAEADRNREAVEPAELARLASAQADLARRFDKLTQSMQEMVNADNTEAEGAARLSDAMAAAASMNLSARLVEAAREISQSQLGRAADSQQATANDLRELVERLRDRAPTDPGEIAERLREIQRQLADLQRRASDAAGQASPTRQTELRRELEQQLTRAARELKRLTAQDASNSAAQAGSSAAPKTGQSPGQVQDDLQQAERAIEQAQRELQQRIAELEGERQQRLLDRLAEVIADLIPRQQQTLETTLKLELLRETQGHLAQSQQQQAEQLSTNEAMLATELSEAMADVERRAVFQLALGGAAEDMQQAARDLAELKTGRVTQSLQLGALSRMRHVLEILREPPTQPPAGDHSPSDQGGGGGGGNEPQQPPLIELAEMKMLRWLQLDLNGRTRLMEADRADKPSEAAQKSAAARRLTTEQQALEELVREMMQRNNSNVQPATKL